MLLLRTPVEITNGISHYDVKRSYLTILITKSPRNVRYRSGVFQFWSQGCIGNGLRGADKSIYLDTVKKRRNHF